MTRARDLAAGTFELATGGVLKLETSDTTVTDGSVLGKIEFKAPDEASGTDAILVGAAIEAVAEGTFAADNNATELVFKTGASAAADAKMTLTSGGNLGIGTSSPSSAISASSTVVEIADSNLATLALNNTSASKWEVASAAGDFLTIRNDNSEVMRIDSSGNVLIGTDTGDSFNADSRLRIGNSGDRAFLQFKTDSNNNSGILFGTETDDVRHQIVHDVTDDALTFVGNSSEAMRIDSTGAVTMPAQPAFLAVSASSQTNIAVGGSAATVVFGTEVFDQNADFASNTFTAPVTGRYQLSFNIRMNDVDHEASYIDIRLSTSNRSYQWVFANDDDLESDASFVQANMSILADMDASDTASVTIFQSGGTAQMDLDTSAACCFSGYLAC